MPGAAVAVKLTYDRFLGTGSNMPRTITRTIGQLIKIDFVEFGLSSRQNSA